ncbi:MAG: 5-(carboxyamino)imidazole ribonucleotide mutase [Peptococcaceae bacterium]|nr:5-(carboxyamino)imidazole ribonucleotide mutase [Peptococcaceae bacterium]
MEAKVGIIMGSDSDFSLMKKTINVLEEFGVGYEVKVSSAHRTPEDTLEYASTAVERGLKVIIAGAGAAAHLPGVIAAKTTLPVIGVPINATALNGLDALYAIVQMPSGVPVASVGIDGAKNAGLLAVQILATADDSLREALVAYKENMKQSVQKKNAKIQQQLAEKKAEGSND